jgi:hypothetical protein
MHNRHRLQHESPAAQEKEKRSHAFGGIYHAPAAGEAEGEC